MTCIGSSSLLFYSATFMALQHCPDNGLSVTEMFSPCLEFSSFVFWAYVYVLE